MPSPALAALPAASVSGGVRPCRQVLPLGLAVVAMLGSLACVSIKVSTPIPSRQVEAGLALERVIPKEIPEKSAPFPHSQYVLLPAETATGTVVGILVPIPFVTGMVEGSINKSAAEEMEARYISVRPYFIMVDAMKGSPLLREGQGALKLRPLVFVQECSDGQYRLTYAAQVQGKDWLGRYLVHLPATYSQEEFAKHSPEVLSKLNRELVAGAKTLRELLERDARGDLKSSGIRAEIGSLHLIGGKPMGMISAKLYKAKHVEVIEEGPKHVLVRMDGDPMQPVWNGGLYFGVHHFQKDQLHTFTPEPVGRP